MKRVDSGKYEVYEFNDFVCDEYFQHWAVRPDDESENFWQQWMLEHPERAKQLQQAKDLLQNIGFREEWPADEKVKSALDRALTGITEEESRGVSVKGRVRRIWRLAVAASFAGALVLAGFFFYQRRYPAPMQYATSYGSTHQIILPDSSLVILNAHSSIRYNSWKPNEPREVWLEGEAFFDVRQDKTGNSDDPGKTHQSFTVHTRDLLIEVLSTAFDIRQRRNKTEVVLQSGKIRVTFMDSSRTPVILNPGDLLSFDPQARTLSQTTTTASDYTAWTSGKLLLPDPNVQQITQYLEDNYGYKVVLTDSLLARKKVEGPILFDNLDDVLFVLSGVLNVNIIKHDSTLIFSSR